MLCLDAPLVAVAWQYLFSRVLTLPVPVETSAALFITAWLIYLADRLVDTFSLDPTRAISLRHQFCAQHRRTWISVMVVLSVCDVWLLTREVDSRIVQFGAGVAAVTFLYLLLNYMTPRVWRAFPLKEITIGSVFAAGTVAALLPQMPTINGPLLLTLLLFAALCSLNCINIAFWERQIDAEQRRESIATAWPTGAKYLLPVGLCIGASALLASRWSRGLAIVDSCIALSVLLLGALQMLRAFVPRDDRTALADLVLLTPLLMLALIR